MGTKHERACLFCGEPTKGKFCNHLCQGRYKTSLFANRPKGLIPIRTIEPPSRGIQGRYLVECVRCHCQYVRQCWPSDFSRVKGCRTCAQAETRGRKRKLSKKARLAMAAAAANRTFSTAGLERLMLAGRRRKGEKRRSGHCGLTLGAYEYTIRILYSTFPNRKGRAVDRTWNTLGWRRIWQRHTKDGSLIVYARRARPCELPIDNGGVAPT